jgi:hypothetical protein
MRPLTDRPALSKINPAPVSAAARLDGGNVAQIRWNLFGREGFDIHFDKTYERIIEIRPLTAAPIDQDTYSDHFPAASIDDVDCFLNATAARHHVFGHNEALIWSNRETAAQDQAARFFLGENVPFA